MKKIITDKKGFVREVIFIKDDIDDYKQVTDLKKYVGLYTLGCGVFKKDNNFYILYSRDGSRYLDLCSECDVNPLNYGWVFYQVFPMEVKVQEFI
jgi:hypothetical protein